MTLQKQYQFKGLNLRQSDILIPPEFASYASNCDLNYSGELRKRNGFVLEATSPSDIIYMVVYQQANELLIMTSGGLRKKELASFRPIPPAITTPVVTWTGDITSVELNGTMYFSDTTGINPVYKYDGITFTRAGVHEPTQIGKTTQLVPAASTARQLFGKTMAYAMGIPAAPVPEPGQLVVLGGGGPFYQYLDTEFGYQPVDSPTINSDLGGSRNGIPNVWNFAFDISKSSPEVLVKVSGHSAWSGLPPNEVHSLDLYLTTYTRPTTNIDWEIATDMIIPFSTFNYQLETVGRVKVSDDGTKIVFNTFMLNGDGSMYTFYQSGPIGNWIQLPVTTGSAGNRTGSYFDFIEIAGEYFLAVCSPGGNTGRGDVVIYKYNLGLNAWDFPLLINSPNAGALNQDEFGKYVSLSHDPAGLIVFIPYRLPGVQTNNQMMIYHVNIATMTTVGAATSIVMPANIFGTIVTRYNGTLADLNNYITISAPDATSVKGPSTKGQALVYQWVGLGTTYSLAQTIQAPETSYDNGTGYTGPGFSIPAIMLPRTPVTLVGRMAMSYPGFSVVNIDGRGKIYTFTTDTTGTSKGYILDKNTTTAEAQYARFYLSYVDANGNLINSEAKTQQFGGDKLKLTIRTSRNTEYNDRYFIDDMATTIAQSFNTSPPITISSSDHNVIVGDRVLVKTYTKNDLDLNNIRPIEFQLVDVTAITGTSVTIDISKIAKDTYITNKVVWNGVTVDYPINGSNQYINIFVSKDEFFNYELLDNPNGQMIITHEADYKDVEIEKVVFAEDPDIFLLDIYDDTVIKKEIPHIRYLGTYQNLLLGANIRYPEEQEKAEFRNRFIWSDASIGGSAETFAPFDYEVIGENIAKELTAVVGTQDNVHVFKNRKCYAISGLLTGGQYRVRELISEETGCVNHNSMIAARGQVLFMSEAGLYAVAGGGNPNELTDANQPLFMSPDIDLYRSVSTLDGKLEKVYTFLKHKTDPTKNLMIVWNYYFNQWYLYEGMGMSGPMVVYNDRLNIADGIYLKEMRDSIFTDVILPGGTTKPVFFKYYTGWFHLGLPSIRKKFVNLVLFSILRLRDYAAIPFMIQPFASEPPNFSLDIKTQLDWIATDWDNFNVPFAPDKRVDDHKLTQTQCKSLRYLIENNRNEPVLLTGYEFEWESTQDKPKGLT